MSAGGLEHVVVVQNGSRRLVKRTGFVKEIDLQSLISSAPEMLGPLGSELAFLPIGREVPLGAGRLDLLFLDSEGILTLIETKRSANDEVRREIVGQILEYAMFASEWSVDNVIQAAEAFLTSVHAPADIAGQTLHEAAATRFGWLSDEEDERQAKTDALLAKLDLSLKKGNLRIVCGVDERVAALERLVGYLSLHSTLQVVLLQVSRFAVDDDMTVLVPTLQGDVGSQDGRMPGAPGPRFTIASLIDSFAAGPEREAIRQLISAASGVRATFETGPSGTSIRVATPGQAQPVTVGWIFAPRKPGWMKTKDISLGHGLDYDTTAPALRQRLDRYYQSLVDANIGVDASSKGVRARSVTAAQTAEQLPKLVDLLTGIIDDLARLR